MHKYEMMFMTERMFCFPSAIIIKFPQESLFPGFTVGRRSYLMFITLTTNQRNWFIGKKKRMVKA